MSGPRTKSAAQERVLRDASEMKKEGNGLVLYRICSLCNTEISPDVGDVIFGEKWYHSLCWEVVEGKTN